MGRFPGEREKAVRVSTAAPGSEGRLDSKRNGDKTINPQSWADRRHTPPTWQMHQMDGLAVKETSPQQMTGEILGLQLQLFTLA